MKFVKDLELIQDLELIKDLELVEHLTRVSKFVSGGTPARLLPLSSAAKDGQKKRNWPINSPQPARVSFMLGSGPMTPAYAVRNTSGCDGELGRRSKV